VASQEGENSKGKEWIPIGNHWMAKDCRLNGRERSDKTSGKYYHDTKDPRTGANAKKIQKEQDHRRIKKT